MVANHERAVEVVTASQLDAQNFAPTPSDHSGRAGEFVQYCFNLIGLRSEGQVEGRVTTDQEIAQLVGTFGKRGLIRGYSGQGEQALPGFFRAKTREFGGVAVAQKAQRLERHTLIYRDASCTGPGRAVHAELGHGTIL